MQRIMVIVNPASGGGRGREIAQEIGSLEAKILAETGKKLEIILSSESGENSIFNLASQAKEEGYKDVFVVGGDGSVSLAAQALINSEIALSIIPTGSGNDFSKALRIPQAPMSALGVALFGETIPFDVGLIDEKYVFINVVSFGFDAKVARQSLVLKEKYSFLPGSWLYLVSLLYQLLASIEYPRIRVSLGMENSNSFLSEDSETLLLAVVNGPQYGGMFKIWPGASPTDRILNICWIKKMSKLGILRNFIKVIKGTHRSLSEVGMFLGRFILVSCSRKLDCQVDGEIFASKKEYRISILPQSLKVRVPQITVPEEAAVPRRMARRRIRAS